MTSLVAPSNSLFQRWHFLLSRALCVTVACVVSVAPLSGVARASTNSGIDTPQGITSLPFAIEGNEIMNLGPTGLAIGTTATAVAPLDVSGGMRGTSSGVVINGSCSPEGMLGYDLTNHEPTYCNQNHTWSSSAQIELISGTTPPPSAPYVANCMDATAAQHEGYALYWSGSQWTYVYASKLAADGPTYFSYPTCNSVSIVY